LFDATDGEALLLPIARQRSRMMKRSNNSRRVVTASTAKRQTPSDFEETGFTKARYYLGRIHRDARHEIHQLVTDRVSLGELLTFLFRDLAEMNPLETAAMLKLPVCRIGELERSVRRRLSIIADRASQNDSIASMIEKPITRRAVRK
jgi:hypothetical protein